MRTILAFVIVCCLTACSDGNRKPVLFPATPVSNDEAWISYEGMLPYDNDSAEVELALLPAAVGIDSKFHLVVRPDDTKSISLIGNYTTDYSGREIYITLLKYNLANVIKNKKGIFAGNETTLRTLDGNQLAYAEGGPGSKKASFTLLKRIRLFTIEGYFYHDDEPEFFERNTHQRWRVLKRGKFWEVDKGYEHVVKEKYEGIYVRALAYSAAYVDNGKETEVLVFKNILKIGQPEI